MIFRADSGRSLRFTTAFCVAVIVGSIALAWSNSLSAPFQLDDHESIVRNPTIRELASFAWLRPPSSIGETVGGRPVLNLSFALNYAIGELDVRGYRFVNIALHALAGLTLFGVMRRTLEIARKRGVPDEFAGPSRDTTALALALTLVWAVHPLHTAAITYVVQRAESLAGVFVLVTLYGFIRAAESRQRAWAWAATSATACALGMATKENAVIAPIIVLLYDRLFLSSGWRAVWRARSRVHLLLAATWLVLGALVLMNSGRGGSAGFGSAIDPWTYFLTQCAAIPHYVRLSFWPVGQVFDYGVVIVYDFTEVLPQLLGLLGIAVGVGWLLWRKRVGGFVGACFFLTLAPSSSVIPVATQTMAEHRMYLPLAALVTAVGLSIRYSVTGRRRPLGVIAALAVAALGLMTHARNSIYRSEHILWQDTVAKRPENPRARNNLGQALLARGELERAAEEYQRALELQLHHAFAHFGLGIVRARQERWDEAVVHFSKALELEPNDADMRTSLAEAHAKLGVRLARERKLADAAEHFRAVLRHQPTNADAHANLGNVLLLRNDPAGALEHYQAALRQRPSDARLEENIRLAREMLRR